MDRFVKGFIVMSIVYLGISTILGLLMLGIRTCWRSSSCIPI